MPGAAWQHLADRLASWGLGVLSLAVILAVVGGVISALLWTPYQEVLSPAPTIDPCPNPPCLWDSTPPRVVDLPVVIGVLGLVLAILLGGPSLLAGVWDVVRTRPRLGAWRALAFFGPLLVLAGMEVIPHVLSPCLLAFLLGSEVPGLCSGWDLVDRWHGLHHAVVGGVPLVLLYRHLRGRSRNALEHRTSATP